MPSMLERRDEMVGRVNEEALVASLRRPFFGNRPRHRAGQVQDAPASTGLVRRALSGFIGQRRSTRQQTSAC
jgi:hypothetical protein